MILTSRRTAQDREQGDVAEFLNFVRGNSPFYHEAWKNLPIGDSLRLQDVPQVQHELYWQANSSTSSNVVTGYQSNGIIMKTGGTTSHPKVSYYSNSELADVGNQLGDCLRRCHVEPGDRIANIFYAGDLYGSFLLHVLSIFSISQGIHLPIAGHTEIDAMIQYLDELQATVILSTVTTIHGMAKRLIEQNRTLQCVRLLLFSGEGFYEDQKRPINEAFPIGQIRSLNYGTIDSGIIGLPAGLVDQRTHLLNSKHIHLDIVSEDGQVITEPNKEGDLVVTNFTRRLMPVVKYACGDRGYWIDMERGYFKVTGRSELSVRIGPVSVDMTDIQRCVYEALDIPSVLVQAVIRREESKDQLLLRIDQNSVSQAEPEVAQTVTGLLMKRRPMFQEEVEKQIIMPLLVKLEPFENFIKNKTTGKMLGVVDQRGMNVTPAPPKQDEPEMTSEGTTKGDRTQVHHSETKREMTMLNFNETKVEHHTS